jgi:hypothetical protein
MPIKTMRNFNDAYTKTIHLLDRFHWQKEGFEHHFRTRTQAKKMHTAWQQFCRAFDRLIYAAGGHRDGCTWWLFGNDISAKDFWDDWFSPHHPNGVRTFFEEPKKRTAHNEMRYLAWTRVWGPLPDPKEPNGLDLPAPGGEILIGEWEQRQRERTKEVQTRRDIQADSETKQPEGDDPSVIDDDDEIPF